MSGQPTPEGIERRASIRYPCSEDGFGIENSCRPLGTKKSESWSATVRDLSTGGMGLLVNRRFEPGTVLTVELHESDDTNMRLLLVRVVRVLQQERTSWLLGCEFPSKMTEAELLTLM